MIPTYAVLVGPILEFLASGKSYHKKDLITPMAEKFNLTEEEKHQLLPSGRQARLYNRIDWACFEMKMAGFVKIESAIVSITDEGKNILEQNPDKVDYKVLKDTSKYKEYQQRTQNKGDKDSSETSETTTPDQSPEDMIISAHKKMKDSVKTELLDKIRKNTYGFFEHVILQLIRKMGYGPEGEVIGRSGDGGIDGFVQIDKLGFEKIYFQAKRWKTTVPIAQVRDFAGALGAHKSKKGIFITSSEFSDDARSFVKDTDIPIILIDGDKLTDYMYEYNLGVDTVDTYDVKKIDEDFFMA